MEFWSSENDGALKNLGFSETAIQNYEERLHAEQYQFGVEHMVQP